MKTFFPISIFYFFTCFCSCTEANKSTAKDDSKLLEAVSTDTVSKAEVKTISAGEKIFNDDCVSCHGLDGKKKHSGAKDLSISVLKRDEIVKIISSAQIIGNRLHAPRFPEVLRDDQIKEVAEYIITLRK